MSYDPSEAVGLTACALIVAAFLAFAAWDYHTHPPDPHTHTRGTVVTLKVDDTRPTPWSVARWGRALIEYPDRDRDWIPIPTQLDYESLRVGQTVDVEGDRIVRVVKDVG